MPVTSNVPPTVSLVVTVILLAVMVPAAKLPLLSRATIVELVFKGVASLVMLTAVGLVVTAI